MPLADIFNHKAAFVKLTDEYTVAEASCSDDGGSSDAATDGEDGLSALLQACSGQKDTLTMVLVAFAIFCFQSACPASALRMRVRCKLVLELHICVAC